MGYIKEDLKTLKADEAKAQKMFVEQRATALKSRTLSTLLLKLRDAPTPFQKVAAWIFVFRMHWFFADHFFPPVPPTATQRSFSALRLIFITK